MANIKNRDWVEPAHPVLVQRFGDLHRYNGEGYGKSRCEPDLVRNDLMHRDADNCTDKMAADKVTRLRQRAIDDTVYEYGGGTKRTDQE